MSDLLGGRVALDGFRGLVACGGFSYGDVLGAGQGWAKSILLHAPTREAFTTFFRREDAFALGVCNGCQALAALKDLIPGAERWPVFVRNQSEQFEARVVSVRVERSPWRQYSRRSFAGLASWPFSLLRAGKRPVR